jgi:hypothetical protein
MKTSDLFGIGLCIIAFATAAHWIPFDAGLIVFGVCTLLGVGAWMGESS